MTKSFFRRHRAIIVFLAIVLGAGGAAAYYLRPKPPVYEFTTVERRDIRQEVSVTGRVKPSSEVNLAFEQGGRVSHVYIKVGVVVQAGALLAELENGDIVAKIEEAKARLASEEAKLKHLKQGTRSEEIDVQRTKVANAKITLDNAKKSLAVVMDDAYTKADDAIRNKADKFFTNPRGANPQITLSLNDFKLENGLETSRAEIESTLALWSGETEQTNASAAVMTKERLGVVKSFLDQSALALSIAIPNPSVSQSAIDGYKTDISTVRANINTALSALDSAEQTFRSAEANVKFEESTLVLKEAPTETNTVVAQEAVVEQVKASIRALEAEAGKSLLRSPIAGTVTKQDVKPGEIVSPNVPLVSIISQSSLEAEAFIPEADIAKIHIGDHASTTLDAYGDTVIFPLIVASIDPAETLIEGVATYKTIFQFRGNDPRVKSGMTANIDILTGEKIAVPALPQRVLIRRENEVFAKVLENGIEKEIPVKTGLRGSDGYVEVLAGLRDGEQIIVSK